ncbi:uncharacterized protein LOC143182611 [Calliopsis andreniformis]|uniref:uncharacterized protein LOC143182611 n=1 Tax=Calliopsis andreniformis TaxID=337506 RepID=UPI003FCDAA79
MSLESISGTRWESRIKAVRPLKLQLDEFLKSLNEIIDDNSGDMKTKHTAQYLLDQVAETLQCPESNINESFNVLNEFVKFLSTTRFDANVLAAEVNVVPEFPVIRSRTKIRQFDYESPDIQITSSKQLFKVQFYLTVVDTALNSIQESIQSLNALEARWFTELITYRTWNSGITDTLKNLLYTIKYNLMSSFPNMVIALRIFLTLPISVASGEKSFSKLTFIEIYLRTSMTPERFNDIGLLAIEKDLCESLELSNIIDELANKKARKTLANKIRRDLSDKRYCSAAFLDVAQVFNKVWYTGLLIKIKELLPSLFYPILKSYLTDRFYQVKIQQAVSILCTRSPEVLNLENIRVIYDFLHDQFNDL